MLVREDVCNPSRCSLECVSACRTVHGAVETPLVFHGELNHPTINSASCTLCLACLRTCPFNAISLSSQISVTKDFGPWADVPLSETRPYEVESSISPMSEADTIFARVQYDPEYEFYQKTEFSGAEVMIGKNIPGYGRFENELSIAAWKLYDSRESIKRSGIGLDSDAREQGEIHEKHSKTLTSMVKKAAKFFGASMVGVAPLDRNWIYSVNRRGEPYDVPDSYQFAIVMAVEMDYDAIATSPAFTSSAATGLGYSMMAFIELELAAFVQRLGYNAITCGNNVALSVPLAIDAGLGQYGRHGLLITKPYGPRVRIAKILTDMPLKRDYPDPGFCRSVIQFCETCKKCATNCPSQSIPYYKEQTWQGTSKSNNSGIKKWYVDVESCYGFWVENGSECSNCIRSCPFNKKDGFFHRTVLWLVQHMSWLNRLIVLMDDFAGYGKQKDSSTFWKKFR
ncbi:MAG: reductive dehalogenase [Candidatus Thorarchaeota archaeon]